MDIIGRKSIKSFILKLCYSGVRIDICISNEKDLYEGIIYISAHSIFPEKNLQIVILDYNRIKVDLFENHYGRTQHYYRKLDTVYDIVKNFDKINYLLPVTEDCYAIPYLGT